MARSTVNGDTGNQATLVFVGVKDAAGAADADVQAFFDNLQIKRVEPSEETSERLDASGLATVTYRKYVAGDLTDPPTLTITAGFDTFDEIPFVGQDLGTLTITFPLRDGETTAAEWSGTVFLLNKTNPTLANGELQEITLVVSFDGNTGPTWTKAT